jgi:hypothetical protein
MNVPYTSDGILMFQDWYVNIPDLRSELSASNRRAK